MNAIIKQTLEVLEQSSNLRTIKEDNTGTTIIDFSTNDYLGIASDIDLRSKFLDTVDRSLPLSASASRLLASHQKAFAELEKTISEAYGARSLLFNSGYHANTGIIAALGSLKNTYIVADKLVHASIIDGIKLSGAPFARFKHNDYQHLASILQKIDGKYQNILIIVESIYSMDGDASDLEAIADIKHRVKGAMLYVDEAHAIGVKGSGGLGMSMTTNKINDIDIIIGTMGKALASTGAYAIVDDNMRQFLINKARSLIFSTAIPPFNAYWSKFTFSHMLGMDQARAHLDLLGQELSSILSQYCETKTAGHIQPLIAGTAAKAIKWSAKLSERGFNVLPIRTPTVPPGTDRLRFSLAANNTTEQLKKLETELKTIIQ